MSLTKWFSTAPLLRHSLKTSCHKGKEAHNNNNNKQQGDELDVFAPSFFLPFYIFPACAFDSSCTKTQHDEAGNIRYSPSLPIVYPFYFCWVSSTCLQNVITHTLMLINSRNEINTTQSIQIPLQKVNSFRISLIS